MTDDLEEFIDAMHVVAYTLVDGSRILGEERLYDYKNGITVAYGVLEFHRFSEVITLSPYVPEAIDTEFVFMDRNIIGRCNATVELKQMYYVNLLKNKLKQVLSPEEYEKYINAQKKTKPKSKPKSNLQDWNGLLNDDGDQTFGGRN